jgi:hypothetical protein
MRETMVVVSGDGCRIAGCKRWRCNNRRGVSRLKICCAHTCRRTIHLQGSKAEEDCNHPNGQPRPPGRSVTRTNHSYSRASDARKLIPRAACTARARRSVSQVERDGQLSSRFLVHGMAEEPIGVANRPILKVDDVNKTCSFVKQRRQMRLTPLPLASSTNESSSARPIPRPRYPSAATQSCFSSAIPAQE